MYRERRMASKYGNVKKTYDGYPYDSKLEAQQAFELDIRKRAGEIKGWRRQVPIECRVNGHLITTYKMDFVVEENDGSETWIEVKGMETYVWKLRWKLLCALYPEVEKEVVKANASYRFKPNGRRTRK